MTDVSWIRAGELTARMRLKGAGFVGNINDIDSALPFTTSCEVMRDLAYTTIKPRNGHDTVLYGRLLATGPVLADDRILVGMCVSMSGEWMHRFFDSLVG